MTPRLSIIEEVAGQCLTPGWTDGFAELVLACDGTILDFRQYGDYSESIPHDLFFVGHIRDFVDSLPKCGLNGVWARAQLALRTKTRQPIRFKHPWTWGLRVGEAIPTDRETVIIRAFIPKTRRTITIARGSFSGRHQRGCQYF